MEGENKIILRPKLPMLSTQRMQIPSIQAASAIPAKITQGHT